VLCVALLAGLLASLLVGCASAPAQRSAASEAPSYSTATEEFSHSASTATAREAAVRPGLFERRPATAPVIPSGPLQSLGSATVPMHGQAVATLQAPSDLWDRMRRGFAMPELDTDLVRHHERWHASRPENIQRMVDRSSKYLFHIVEEVERRGLPMELALVPFIESAFNPHAVSPARAAGLWQFMPATGRSFELMQNAFRDDRLDVLASTNAALDYLERLNRMFNGDWQLALAAYNWGNGNVSRGIQRNRAAGLGIRYVDLRMPDETRNYVPKIQALKNIILDPQAHNIRLPHVGNHPFFYTVTLDRDMDVSLIAELAQVSPADFRLLNPSHNKPMIMAAATPTILLPWDNALLFEERLRQHAGQTASWTVWRVPSNMTTAEAARQHNLTEAQIREINQIPPRRSLRAGSTILVPRQEGLDADVPRHLADSGQVLLAPARTATRASRHTVQAGDTLSSIARRHGVTVANIQQWNKLRPQQTLRIGQVLVLQIRDQAAAPAAAAVARSTHSTHASQTTRSKVPAHRQ
jgi:membrane-bound lytic murein transglycosylase D